MTLTIELDREGDGRWIAEVPELPGVLVYGGTEEEAIDRVRVLGLQVLADKLAHGELEPEVLGSPGEIRFERQRAA